MATFLVLCCLVGSLVGQEEVVMPNVPEEVPDNGPTIRVQIPTELKEKGRQYNKLEMAKRIAAARQANKEAARIEGRQLSWESLALPKVWLSVLLKKIILCLGGSFGERFWE